jgi:hypothetical protein
MLTPEMGDRGAETKRPTCESLAPPEARAVCNATKSGMRRSLGRHVRYTLLGVCIMHKILVVAAAICAGGLTITSALGQTPPDSGKKGPPPSDAMKQPSKQTPKPPPDGTASKEPDGAAKGKKPRRAGTATPRRATKLKKHRRHAARVLHARRTAHHHRHAHHGRRHQCWCCDRRARIHPSAFNHR